MNDPFMTRNPGTPSEWPIGSRVVVPEAEDFHFFRPGTRGTVIRHGARAYLGVIVHLDIPIRCNHGHYEHLIEEFNFNAADLSADREETPA